MINLLGLLLLVVFSNASLYIKHTHDISTGARCLDGSPSALLINVGAEHNKILLYFLGGGFCQGSTQSAFIESCYQRSSTELGTSLLYPSSMNLDSYGILSTVQATNPPFWNWTKVVIPYCDGTFHQGTVENPVEYKNKSLYFRGANNTLQHFKYLNDYFGLYSADKIVVTGESAGGIASFIWTDQLYDLSKTKNVYSIPDSGLFLTNYPNPTTGAAVLTPYLEILFNFVNKETPFPTQDCIKAEQNVHTCLNFSNTVKYFKAPLFIVESAYDEYSLSVILRERCLTAGTYGSYNLDKCSEADLHNIEAYRTATLAAINNFTSLEQFGAWVPACVQHGFSHEKPGWTGATYMIPSSTGSTLSAAVQNFINNPKDKSRNIHIDSVQWPNNPGCSAHHAGFKLRKGEKTFFERLITY